MSNPKARVIIVDDDGSVRTGLGRLALFVGYREVAHTSTKMTVPIVFTASESVDIAVDLVSLVSRDYAERRPFKFEGK